MTTRSGRLPRSALIALAVPLAGVCGWGCQLVSGVGDPLSGPAATDAETGADRDGAAEAAVGERRIVPSHTDTPIDPAASDLVNPTTIDTTKLTIGFDVDDAGSGDAGLAGAAAVHHGPAA